MGELLVQRIHLPGRQTPLQPHHKQAFHKSAGVIGPVEPLDFSDRLLSRIHDAEEIEILRRNQLIAQHVLPHKVFPFPPVGAARHVNQHDRMRIIFPSLQQCQDFEGFIVRSVPTGKDGAGMGFTDEKEFPAEKVFEGNQLRIVDDRGVGALLERKQDVDAEAIVPPRALVRGPHDAVARAGDHHEAPLAEQPCKAARERIQGMISRHPSRPEDAHLTARAVGLEDAERVPHFFETAIEDL